MGIWTKIIIKFILDGNEKKEKKQIIKLKMKQK